jgi:hypothetical protein
VEQAGGGVSVSFGDVESIVPDSSMEAISGGIDTGGGIVDVVENMAEGGVSVLGAEGGIVAVVILRR